MDKSRGRIAAGVVDVSVDLRQLGTFSMEYELPPVSDASCSAIFV
jgi:hypothetical protein